MPERPILSVRGIAPVTKPFEGHFLIYRKVPRGFARAGMPRFRHPDFSSAEIAAGRLLDKHPESTFVIMQEIATVKVRDVSPHPAITDALGLMGQEC
jgi:hypothetical protein